MKPKIVLLFIAILVCLTGCEPLPEITEDNLDTYSIITPQIQNNYNFLFLADMHLLISEEGKQEHAVPFSLSQWIDYANYEKVDGFLMGGDILDGPSPSNLYYLDKTINKLKMPYVYTLGNHDWNFSWEYMTDKSWQEYRTLFLPYMEENPSIHMKEYEDIIIVAVDNSANQIQPEVLDEYKKILAMGKPIILMLHVPLITQSVIARANQIWKSPVVLGAGNFGGIYPNESSEEFIQLTTVKNSPVLLILAGHVHFADMDYVEGEKNIPQIVTDASDKGRGTMIHIRGTT